MNTDHYDVVVIGAGMVGLSLVAALSQAQFSVALIDPQAAPQTAQNDRKNDIRVSAIHLGTQQFLEHLGVWPAIRRQGCAPIQHMQVWDAGGAGQITFNASDITRNELGYIALNSALRSALWEPCAEHPCVDLYLSSQATQLIRHQHYAQVCLEPQHTIAADLIVGADGTRSWLRAQMAADEVERPEGHTALLATVETEHPHQHTAYQAFLPDGPLGVLPLPDPHHVAIIWSSDLKHSEKRAAMLAEPFNRELESALKKKLGRLCCISERLLHPLFKHHTKRYVQSHLALVGDAAHTLHPLAGQGANLGFMDVACLVEILKQARAEKKRLGDYSVLRRYERWRKSENTGMLLAVNGLRHLFSTTMPLASVGRHWGLRAVDACSLLKKRIMRYATHAHFP